MDAPAIEDIVNRLAETDAATVYGDPVERGDRTVVPAARVSWGAGAGGSEQETEDGDDDEESAGFGAGAGLSARPAGYIEVTDRGSRFVPARDPGTLVAAVLVGVLLGWLLRRPRKGGGE